MLEELPCSELVGICEKAGLSTTYRNKSELVDRLHEYGDKDCTPAIPDKDFFLYMRQQWKVAKSKNVSRVEFFREAITTWKDEENVPVGTLPSHLKCYNDLLKISKSKDPGDALRQYYNQGKFAWLSQDGSSSGEEFSVAKQITPPSNGAKSNAPTKATEKENARTTKATEENARTTKATEEKQMSPPANGTESSTVNTTELYSGSESAYSNGDDSDGDDSDDDDSDDDDSDDDDSDDDDKDEINLNVSPAGTWVDASKLKKAVWKKDRKWCRYMKAVLPDQPPEKWTMKRFLQKLCSERRASDYKKVCYAVRVRVRVRVSELGLTTPYISNRLS